jgi:hypothetical protein
MVELVAGSGVYVYDKTISQAFKVGTERETGTYSGEKMARYLLNVFWSRKDLVGATLSKAGRGKKILNQQIIEAKNENQINFYLKVQAIKFLKKIICQL